MAALKLRRIHFKNPVFYFPCIWHQNTYLPRRKSGLGLEMVASRKMCFLN